jgi:hypothetical protein
MFTNPRRVQLERLGCSGNSTLKPIIFTTIYLKSLSETLELWFYDNQIQPNTKRKHQRE